MDPIGDVKYAKDTTLAMLLAAQAKGLELTYLEQGDLSLRDGAAFGRMRSLTVKADPDLGRSVSGRPNIAIMGR